MKVLFIIFGLLLFTGCTTKKPSVTEYKIVSTNTPLSSNASACKDKSLKVAQAFSSSSLMSLKMDYSLPENKVFSYSESQWNESPNHLITKEVLNEVRAINLFKDVQVSKSRSKSDLILETNIEEFMQYYSSDLDKSYSSIVINLTIIDSKTGAVVASQIFKSKFDAEKPDANSGVEALNRALNEVLKQSSDWLDGVCK